MKIIATTVVLLLTILGLGYSLVAHTRSDFEKPNFSCIVAVFGSGFSLLTILGSLIGLIPIFGRNLLIFVVYFYAVVGSIIANEMRLKFQLLKKNDFVILGKSEFTLAVLISIVVLSVFIKKVVALETYSDAVQIYLPFFEFFQTSGSTLAVLEKPAFSSFIQARGLGTHLAATALGGWTSAQVGSFLAVALIAILIFWSVTDHSKRIINLGSAKSSWFLALTASFATLFYYSSAELFSKTHIVTFSLLITLAVSFPSALDKSELGIRYFKKTANLSAAAICVVYPLNFFAVVLVVVISVIFFCLYRKPFLISQVFRSIFWAAGSTLGVFVSNLYFVGVLSTEPMLRSVKVDGIFEKFSSEEIWLALYGVQGLGAVSTYIKEPFVSQGLFAKDSISSIIYLFDARGYLFFVIGAMGFVIIVWKKLNATLLLLCVGLVIFGITGFFTFRNLNDTVRLVSIFLGISGVTVIKAVTGLAKSEHKHFCTKSKIRWPLSPFLFVNLTLCTFAVAFRIISQPSFERLALQGTLGILLLPGLLAFGLSQFNLRFNSHSLTMESRRKKFINLKTNREIFLLITYVFALLLVMALIQIVFPQNRLILIALVSFNSAILGSVFLRVWQIPPAIELNFHSRTKGLSVAWLIVLLFLAAGGWLPTYPKPTTWSAVDWSNEMARDFRASIGLDGFMPDSSEILGFHTKKDILRCLELASILPGDAKAFPVNGLFEFAVCQGTPGLNRGQLVHHYDSVLAPRFKEIIESEVDRTFTIFHELGVDYLLVLKGDCTRFLVSESVAFDANSLNKFYEIKTGSDFIVLDIRLNRQVNSATSSESLSGKLLEYSRTCQLSAVP